MLAAVWILLCPGVLAAAQLGTSERLVPWPGWLGAWLADADDHQLPEDRQCALDSRLVLEHFQNHTAWAARMIDASSAGPAPGLLLGTTDNLGHFDECLGLQWPRAPAAPLQPQYCLVTMRAQGFSLPTGVGAEAWATAEHVDPYADVRTMMQGRGQHRAVVPLGKLRFGVCLPASCSADAVARAAQRHLSAQPGRMRWTAGVDHPHFCTRREHVTEGASTRRVFTGVLALIVLLVFLGTTMDPQGAADLKKLTGLQKLSAFSVRRHWSELTKPMEKGAIAGLSGYKVYMCVVVVVFHHFLVQEAMSVGANSFAAPADGSIPLLLAWMQDCIHNGMVLFFFISGFLMVRAAHRATLLAPLQRAIRFLPLLGAMTVVQAVLLPAWSSGPAWRWRMEFERDDCRRAWWRTLLYVNNFGPRGAPTCVIQLWSMAVDFQCFAVCQLAMWSWARWQQSRRPAKSLQQESDAQPKPTDKRSGDNRWARGELGGALLALLLTVAVRIGMAVYYEWPFVLPMDHASCAHLETATELFRPYTPTSIHLLSYVLGGVVAILVKPLYRKPEQAIIGKTAGDVIFTVLIGVIAYRSVLAYEAWRDAVRFGPVLDAFAATLRQLVSCALAAAHVLLLEPRIAQPNTWQRVLGSRPLVALHRLTPLVFLVHMFPVMTTVLSARGPVDQSTTSLVSDAATLVVQSFLLALVIQLTVKGPLSALWDSWTWARPATKATDGKAADAKVHAH